MDFEARRVEQRAAEQESHRLDLETYGEDTME